MRRLNVGVIGLGVGAQHLAAYQSLPECRIIAICDLSEEKLAKVRRSLPEIRTTLRADDIWAAPDVDVISIASFDDAHYEQALAALNSGKHVFVEKPLCRSLGEIGKLKEALLRKPGLRLASNLVLRAAPLYESVKKLVAEGRFGRLYSFDGDYLYGRLEKITGGWRSGVADYSVMLGGGVHLVDLMLWLTGEKPLEVAAAGNRICSEATFRYNDYVAATFRFQSGLIGRITANFGCVHRHQHVVRLFGTDATFIYDDQGPRLHTSRDPNRKPESMNLQSLPESKGSLIPRFIREILDGSDNSRSVQHEFDLISLCVYADAAVASGSSLKIEYA